MQQMQTPLQTERPQSPRIVLECTARPSSRVALITTDCGQSRRLQVLPRDPAAGLGGLEWHRLMVRRALKTLPFCGAYTALLWCSHCLFVVLTLPFCCAHTAFLLCSHCRSFSKPVPHLAVPPPQVRGDERSRLPGRADKRLHDHLRRQSGPPQMISAITIDGSI